MRVLRLLPGAESVRLLALDTDRASLEATGLPAEDQLLAGELWRGGRGCGGSDLDGQRAVAHERPRLENVLRDSKFLLVLCGLGGGTASGGAQVVTSVAAKLKLPNLFLVTLPFMLEGPRRRNLAEKVLIDLFDVADAVVTLPDDLLFSTLPGDVPLAAAFEMADRECAGTALALSAVLGAGNLLNADMASLTALLKRRKSLCSIGIGIVRGEDGSPAEETPEKLVSGMLASPLLGGPQVLKAADAAVVSMLGGADLSLGDVKNTLELVAKYLPAGAEQLTAASSRPDWQGGAAALRADDQVFGAESGAPSARGGGASASRTPAARRRSRSGSASRRAAGIRARPGEQGDHGADDAGHLEQRGSGRTDLQAAQTHGRRRPQEFREAALGRSGGNFFEE